MKKTVLSVRHAGSFPETAFKKRPETVANIQLSCTEHSIIFLLPNKPFVFFSFLQKPICTLFTAFFRFGKSNGKQK